MKTTDLVMIGGLGLGAYWLYMQSRRGATDSSPVQQPVTVVLPQWPTITPQPSPQPVPQPTPQSGGVDLFSKFLGALGQTALALFPEGAPQHELESSFSGAQQPGYSGLSFARLGDTPFFSVDFTQNGWGTSLFTPGEFSFAL